MAEEPVEPRKLRDGALTELAREDLELYGVEELEVRIVRLEAEIERTRGQLERKRAGRAAADALFKFAKD